MNELLFFFIEIALKFWIRLSRRGKIFYIVCLRKNFPCSSVDVRNTERYLTIGIIVGKNIPISNIDDLRSEARFFSVAWDGHDGLYNVNIRAVNLVVFNASSLR